jgi:adenosyl cobinamide kinase/adenosyl cobinamide phosphate guanylyltransferase
MKNPIKTALTYKHKFGFCVVPCNGKIPLVDWKDFQKEQPSDEKITAWWTRWPNAGIALVTGEVSGGICAVDIDGYKDSFKPPEIDELVGETTEMPISRTPSGGHHWWFCTDEEIGDRIGFLPAVDFRSGGIIILPFSDGYKWEVKLSETEIPKLPQALIDVLKQSSNKPVASKKPVGKYFGNGRRDNDLFSVANSLIKAGCDPEFAKDVLNRLTTSWEECDTSWVATKIQSALKRHTEVTLVEDIRTWVESTCGDFMVTSMYQDLQLSIKDRKTCTQILTSMVTAGNIEHASRKNGHYRKINKEREIINWRGVKPFEYYDIKMPLGIHNMCNIKKTNIIVIAGTSNAGKTAFALNVAVLNPQHKVRYLCSEMDDTELSERIACFEKPEDAWNHVEFSRLDGSGAYCVDPNGLNIVDYIEPTDGEFYKMQGLINAIHSKLVDGIAVINIQKKPGELFGKGGSGTVERARLYMSMEFQELKFVKVKSPKKINGIGKELEGTKINFKLFNNSTFYEQERN